jgi:hypothetical protein
VACALLAQHRDLARRARWQGVGKTRCFLARDDRSCDGDCAFQLVITTFFARIAAMAKKKLEFATIIRSVCGWDAMYDRLTTFSDPSFNPATRLNEPATTASWFEECVPEGANLLEEPVPLVLEQAPELETQDEEFMEFLYANSILDAPSIIEAA